MPLNRTVAAEAMTLLLPPSRLFEAHALERFDFDVLQHAVHLVGAADVDILHDVAVALVDGDRTTRAFERASAHEAHELVGIEGRALLRIEPIVDEPHRIPGRNRTPADARARAIELDVIGHELL